MNQLSTYLNKGLFKPTLLTLAILTPLFFWNITSEFYETPKFIVAVIITLVLLVIWALSSLSTGKLSFTKTPLDLPLLILLAIFIVSTVLSPSRWSAVMGNLPRIHGGLASMVIYVLLYFTVVSNIKKAESVKPLSGILVIAGTLLSVVTLFSYFGKSIINLPFTTGMNFTPAGSNFSSTAMLAIIIPFLLAEIISRNNSVSNTTAKIVSAVLLTLFLTTIILTGTLASYVAAIASFILVFLSSASNKVNLNLPYILGPSVLALLVVFLSFSLLGGAQNILHTKAVEYSKLQELQLPLSTSWKISISTFRDSPIWGSGPASYLLDFTNYKPVDFNQTNLWNIRFDQAFNEYLHFLATVGAAGLIAFLLLAVVFISWAFKSLSDTDEVPNLPWAISGIVFFIILALHAGTVPLWILGIIILASFMAVHSKATEDINLGFVSVSEKKNSVDSNYMVMPYLFIFVVLALAVVSLYLTGRAYLADYNHRLALNSVASNDGLKAYNYLVQSESLNPYVDLYHTDLAQTNFAIANSIALSKGPTEASPSGSLTDQDKQNIQTLLSQAINEGRIAVTLNPNNSGNWEVLGSIYRQISGVAQNALSFSLDSYGRAIEKDPFNPLLRLTVGGIYYSVKNYDMAIRFFTDAVNLKPDYANGYYNLAIALKDKGDLPTAIASMERTVSLLDPKNPDYKVASDTLADLRKSASQSANKQTENASAPAAKTNSALENKKLPKVLDLPKPDKISSPAAIQK